MPAGNWHPILVGGDPVPQRLNVIDLLLDVEFIEAWRRKR